MKSLRLVVLLLMAVLLPVRGVVAATMQCAPGPMPVAAQAHDHGAHDHADPHDHREHHDHGSADSGHGSCPACAIGCCMPSLTAPAAAWGGFDAAPAADFPAIDVPALSFLSAGPERPPRTV